MTDKKPSFSATLRSFLIYFLTFYVLFWGWQNFIAKPDADTATQTVTDLQLIPTQNKFTIGRPFSVSLVNNQDVAWDYAEPCADNRRLIISRTVLGEQGIPLEYSQSECENSITAQERITVPAGGSHTFTFGALNAQLFPEAGNYRVSLPDAVLADLSATEAVQADLVYKEPNFIVSGFRTVITQPLFNLLVFLVDKLPSHSLGWAIIAMTLMVRLVLIVPNQKAMKSQRKLQKLQPEIQSLKKKHGDNQQAMAMATMGLYKKHKINPMSSCLPILLQMPFLLGIYFVVQDGIAPHFQSLLYDFQANADLSLVENAFFGLDLSIPNMLVLPVIVGLAQFVAMKLAIPSVKKEDTKAVTKKKSKKQSDEPDMAAQMQKMQQMMVYVMPLMIAFFTATFPAGVGIYWLTSTIFGIGQQKFVNWQLDKPKVKRKED